MLLEGPLQIGSHLRQPPILVARLQLGCQGIQDIVGKPHGPWLVPRPGIGQDDLPRPNHLDRHVAGVCEQPVLDQHIEEVRVTPEGLKVGQIRLERVQEPLGQLGEGRQPSSRRPNEEPVVSLEG